MLRTGLTAASWLSVDDTGARHKHQNGFCTQLGNDHFAAFVTTSSKSRLNFLELLRAGYSDYVINAEALGPVSVSMNDEAAVAIWFSAIKAGSEMGWRCWQTNSGACSSRC